MKNLFFITLMVMAFQAKAVTYIYTGTGNWTDVSNWNIYPAPSSGIFTVNSNDLIQVPFGSDLNINITVLNTGTFEIYGAATNSNTLNNFGTLFVFGTFSQNNNFTNTGSIKGNGIFGGNIYNDGTLQPRGPAGAIGTLEVFGDYTQDGGSMLHIEIDGTAGQGISGGHSSVFVLGTMNYDGMLSVTLDMFMPSAGDEFVLIDHFGDSGTFSSMSLPDISPLMWIVEYQTDHLNLIADAVVPYKSFDLKLSSAQDGIILEWRKPSHEYQEFIVQRKTEDIWMNIGEVDATERELEFKDFSPSGLNYYRIVAKSQTDQLFSDVKSIQHMELTDTPFRIGPNPTNGKIFIDWIENVREDYSLEVLNISGQVLRKESCERLGNILDLDIYQDGFYILKFDNGFKTISHKILKI